MNSRENKSIKSLSLGIIWQVTNILMTFVVRLAMAKTLGVEEVSLNTLIGDAISFLSLAELGFGSAITYHLYKPLAEKDTEHLKALMTLYKKVYLIIGLAILAAGAAFAPFVPMLITKVQYDTSFLYTVYALSVLRSAVSYLFSYKSSLLCADQHQSRVYRKQLIVLPIAVILEIFALILTKNLIAFLAIDTIRVMFTFLLISFSADKSYPFLKEEAALDEKEKRSIFRDVKHLFISSVCGKVTTSTNTIMISVLVATTMVGKYGQYAMLANGLFGIFSSVQDSISGSIGNLLVTDDRVKARSALQHTVFTLFITSSVCACCLFSVSELFVRNVFGEQYVIAGVTGIATMFLLAFNFFFSAAKIPFAVFVKASGLFRADRNIAVIGTIANIVLSIVLGIFIGVPGILLGTTVSIIIQAEMRMDVLSGSGIDMSGFKRKWRILSLIAVAEMCATYWMSVIITGDLWILVFLERILVSGLTVYLINRAIYGRTEDYRYARNYILQILKRLRPHKGEKNNAK